MIKPEERFMIKQQYQTGLSITEIARRNGRDRKTVRAALQQPIVPSRRARRKRVRKIDPYVGYLQQRIEQGVLNAEKLYQEIKAQGYTGKARTVRSFVQPYRGQRQCQATVRFETAPGEQAQVDWAHFGYIEHRGRWRRLYGFVITLSWSRLMYLEFTTSTRSVWFLRAHQHAFDYFGGVPRQILHDNVKTAVLDRKGGVIHWNPQYLDFAAYYGFSPRACRPYRAQTKGKVESGIRYIRGNFWSGLVYSDLADLNRQARDWLDRVANVRCHGTTQEIPFERWPAEQLQPLPPLGYDTSLLTTRRSSHDCLISYEGCFYSVPATYARRQLLVKETEQEQLLIFTPTGEEIARHPLAWKAHQRLINPDHYQSLWPTRVRQIRSVHPALNGWEAPAVENRSLSVYDEVSG